jgi:3-oxoacyl-[acyl-carrier protein] reductase
MRLTGRVAVVTGGSRGIGRSIAEALAAHGAAVAIMYREREAPAREFEADVQARGGRAWAGQCHVGDEASVAAFFETATTQLGPVDILVNNAGVTRDAHVVFHDRARWDEVLSVNLDGPITACAPSCAACRCAAGAGSSTSSPSARLPLTARSATRRVEGGARGADACPVARSGGQRRAGQRRSPGLIETEMLGSVSESAQPNT